MKLTCPIVEDLLPFYHEKTCSRESRQLVEEHLIECINCRHMLADLQEIIPYVNPAERKQPVLSVDKFIEQKKWNTLVNGVVTAVLAGTVLCLAAVFYRYRYLLF